MSGTDSSGVTKTVWLERDDLLSKAPSYPQLTSDAKTDVVVVGGGIAGLHIAYELLSTGQKKVILLEDGKIGSGETGRTTGHLSADIEYNDFLKLHGADGTAQIAAAQQAAIDRIASIVEKHQIDCDFVRVSGYMFHGLPTGSADFRLDILEELYNAAENTATFRPTKYIQGLAKAVSDMGGEIYEKTRYMSHSEENGGVTASLDNDKKVQAQSLVMATNVPLQKLVMIERVEALRTYAVALKIRSEDVSSNGEQALWWDLGDPYHYVRVTPSKQEGYSLLVVGGEDEKVGKHDDYEERFQRLESWARERWTSAGDVQYKWSGQVLDSPDGIAYIGRDPGEDNVYVHTGDNGDGLTYAAIGGILISDLILGKENPWAHTFSPSRQHSGSHLKQALKTLPDVVKENLSDQVYFTKWITTCTKTMTDIEDLVPGQGDVVRQGLSPVAVYKDEQGQVHKMTAICPHLKGIVAWNSAEKSFDCPIHGSRFTCKGEVVNGPAKGPLQPK
ncbi:uncharacterized protein I303_100012 [Kwoniella dejecticola CBS 10117]|uniref:Rieske domain-containing protein n=1 Tax=Kwoniella dejecticola CBS 10117 TaxID=1296121 RepID=A0A1A6ADQ3_9TREE|nr:uncharacterized protein I303_00012 [Kwoniella dejecticola CBS 10117]OBR88201.1 hypothetical protein I303_00012 [Kwoniella dejecticola CBS 10117]